jgi:hypothetical protein
MDAHRMTTDDEPFPGKPCQQLGCDGKLRVETTRVIGELRLRNFKCDKCRKAPANNRQWVPLPHAPPQAPRRK